MAPDKRNSEQDPGVAAAGKPKVRDVATGKPSQQRCCRRLAPDAQLSHSAASQGPQAKHPRKSFYRARAHSNPFNDNAFDAPVRPDDVDW